MHPSSTPKKIGEMEMLAESSLLRQPLMTNGYKLHLPMAWVFPRGWILFWKWFNGSETTNLPRDSQRLLFNSVNLEVVFAILWLWLRYVLIRLLILVIFWVVLLMLLSASSCDYTSSQISHRQLLFQLRFKHKTSRYVQNTVHWKWNGSSLSSKSCASISFAFE